jgi:hypothetical protein
MNRWKCAAQLALVGCALAAVPPPVLAAPILPTATFTWFCDSNCDVASALRFSVSFDLDAFPVDGTTALFSGTIRSDLIGGEGGTNSILGSQAPSTVAAVVGARNDIGTDRLELMLSSPAVFYYGFYSIELTASGLDIFAWNINSVAQPMQQSIGHFSYCEESGVGACTNFTASVPEPTFLLLLSTGIVGLAIKMRNARGRAVVAGRRRKIGSI